MKSDYPFEVDHVDEWRNIFVVCPVCKDIYKRDGILKHAQRTEGHKDFMKDYNSHPSTKVTVKKFVSKSVGKPIPQSSKNKNVTKGTMSDGIHTRRAFYNVKRKPLS